LPSDEKHEHVLMIIGSADDGWRCSHKLPALVFEEIYVQLRQLQTSMPAQARDVD